MEYSYNKLNSMNEFKTSNNKNIFYFDYELLNFKNKIPRKIEIELENSIKIDNVLRIQCVCKKKNSKIEDGILELTRLMCVLNKNNVKIICAIINEDEKNYELNILFEDDKKFNYDEITDALNAN